MDASEVTAAPRDVMKICVYCGSATGSNPSHLAAARALGQAMAEAGIGLVYGGGALGLMGEIARTVLAHGGNVTGIIPTFLERREHMLANAQELIVVPDMHTRKRMMFEKADAFVALPGGVGTLEELVEQLTWVQLGRHTKPVVIADIDGFWQPLLALLTHMRGERFIREDTEVRYLVARKAEDILPLIRTERENEARAGRTKDSVDPRL